jgi:hypothetical protein
VYLRMSREKTADDLIRPTILSSTDLRHNHSGRLRSMNVAVLRPEGVLLQNRISPTKTKRILIEISAYYNPAR